MEEQGRHKSQRPSTTMLDYGGTEEAVSNKIIIWDEETETTDSLINGDATRGNYPVDSGWKTRQRFNYLRWILNF